jgi:hypothetical protein
VSTTVIARLTVATTVEQVGAVGSASRASFGAEFKTHAAHLLGAAGLVTTADEVDVVSIMPGSVVVGFQADVRVAVEAGQQPTAAVAAARQVLTTALADPATAGSVGPYVVTGLLSLVEKPAEPPERPDSTSEPAPDSTADTEESNVEMIIIVAVVAVVVVLGILVVIFITCCRPKGGGQQSPGVAGATDEEKELYRLYMERKKSASAMATDTGTAIPNTRPTAAISPTKDKVSPPSKAAAKGSVATPPVKPQQPPRP